MIKISISYMNGSNGRPTSAEVDAATFNEGFLILQNIDDDKKMGSAIAINAKDISYVELINYKETPKETEKKGDAV